MALAGLLLAPPVCALLPDLAVLDGISFPREWNPLALTLAGIFLAGLRQR